MQDQSTPQAQPSAAPTATIAQTYRCIYCTTISTAAELATYRSPFGDDPACPKCLGRVEPYAPPVAVLPAAPIAEATEREQRETARRHHEQTAAQRKLYAPPSIRDYIEAHPPQLTAYDRDQLIGQPLDALIGGELDPFGFFAEPMIEIEIERDDMRPRLRAVPSRRYYDGHRRRLDVQQQNLSAAPMPEDYAPPPPDPSTRPTIQQRLQMLEELQLSPRPSYPLLFAIDCSNPHAPRVTFEQGKIRSGLVAVYGEWTDRSITAHELRINGAAVDVDEIQITDWPSRYSQEDRGVFVLERS